MPQEINFENLDSDTKLNVMFEAIMNVVEILTRIEEKQADLEERIQNLNFGENYDISEFN